MLARAVLMGCLAAPLGSAWAATVSGNIVDGSGVALSGIEVRALTDSAGKGWIMNATAFSDGAGNYTFTLQAGDYIVQVAAAAISGTCFRANRYYDALAPAEGGRVESAADVLTLAVATILTGINITMPIGGALEATVTHASVGIPGLQVRVEISADSRIHNDGMTFSGPNAGLFTVCGLDPGQHRVWIHDPNASYEDLLLPGPFVVNSGAKAILGDQPMAPIGTDPYEPNDPATPGTSLPASPVSWESSGAIISPRGSDVDFYCFDALAGDRYVITATTGVSFGGELRASPWVDPLLGWFAASPLQLLASNDDDPSGAGPLDARIDTGSLPTDARYCVGVTTFGDSDFNGTAQGSAGRYELRVAAVPVPLFGDDFETGDLSSWSRTGEL